MYEKYIDIENFTPENRHFLEDYICPLCKGVLHEPKVDQCSHLFCDKCINLHLLTETKCPISNNIITKNNLISLEFITQILEKRKVYCKNRVYDCDWIGVLSQLDTHLSEECKRVLKTCKYTDCEWQDFKAEIIEHETNCEFKPVLCKFCNQNVPAAFYLIHEDNCTKAPELCTNLCGEKIIRENLTEHLKNECRNALISCPYKDYGCKEIVTRDSIGDHLILFVASHNTAMITQLKFNQTTVIDRLEQLQKQFNNFEVRMLDLEKHINSKAKRKQKNIKRNYKKYLKRQNGHNQLIVNNNDNLYNNKELEKDNKFNNKKRNRDS